ncbi:membrane protein [Streptomyces sp. WM6373]|nr:membrane protein [Streptomyces sp. WM6373]KOU79755.1 membrane protein [Streptomyces sp. XY66]KOU87257.1 membrane protein [Streptomyces sp. XY58]KOV07846.1 membrane protein [Streptomyces sp. XY37]KOV33197.1 membrane protein [Streptomyces sp. H021]KOV48173.1 membrane protein [Streptomyces sp. MMG1064]
MTATGSTSVFVRPRDVRAVGVPTAALALGVFAAVRVAGAAVLAFAAWWAGRSPLRVLGHSWDSVWYLAIARHGYGRTQMWPVTGLVQSDYAFFPLYPVLVRLSGGGEWGALLVAWTAAAVAAVGVYRVGELVAGRRVALLLVALWAVVPHAVVLTLAYTEPLLVALAAWSLYALLRERWLLAASLALLAGLTRPTGVAVAAAVSVTAAHALLVRRSRAPEVWAAGLLAPAGWLAYVAAVGVRRHDVAGYFTVQRQWGSRFDGGGYVLSALWRVLSGGPVALATGVTAVLLGTALLLAVLLLFNRPPLPLLVYTAVLLVITLGGAGYFESKPRFLLPAFPLLLPLAAVMARARPRSAVVVTAGLAGLSYAYGVYLLVFAKMPP